MKLTNMFYGMSFAPLVIFLIAFGTVPQVQANIFYRVYTGSTINKYVDVLSKDASYLSKYLDYDKKTVFYIHGFISSCDNDLAVEVCKAFLSTGNHNVVCVDFRDLVSIATAYIGAVANTRIIANTIATAIAILHSQGLKSIEPHLVGFSIGAQIAGFVGKLHSNTKLQRITALEPAGPLFYCIFKSCNHLLSTDANEVYVLHTDMKLYGSPVATKGAYNFYVNGGSSLQPGCPGSLTQALLSGLQRPAAITNDPLLVCSHMRAGLFWAEAVTNNTSQYAIQCDSWYNFKNGKCAGNRITNVGLVIPKDLPTGDYYYLTNPQSKYGLGISGTIPVSSRISLPIGALAV